MKVRFEPLHGQDYVATPDVGGGFTAGQVRDLPDDDAAYLLTNRNFVDDATGKNPLYSCEECDEPIDRYVFDPEVGMRLPDRCEKHRDGAPVSVPGAEPAVVAPAEAAAAAFVADAAPASAPVPEPVAAESVAEPITPEREE